MRGYLLFTFYLNTYICKCIFFNIWDMPNPNSKTLSTNFGLIEKGSFDQNLSGFVF